MRKFTIITVSTIALLALLINSGVSDSLLVFFLSGSLPGTTISLSPNVMIIAFAAIAWLVLVRLTALGAVNIFTMRRLLARHNAKQKRMPKRRYSRI